MPYRRNPWRRGMFNRSLPKPAPDIAVKNVQEHKVEDIPLPNEAEAPPRNVQSVRKKYPPTLIDLFKGHIHIDDIILIGLIFVLLQEGIEDEFLLIMLIYLLLTSRDA